MNTTYNPLSRPASVGSLLIGNFAAAWGFLVAPIYVVGFALLWPKRFAPGGVPTLPLALPLIGVVLASIALVAAWGREQAGQVPAIVGLVLNGVPMILAALLWYLSQS